MMMSEGEDLTEVPNIAKADISLAKRYDDAIAILQKTITSSRDLLDRVENKNLVLNNKKNLFIANLNLVINKAIDSFEIVTDKRNELYGVQ
jgi:hypothetical protein